MNYRLVINQLGLLLVLMSAVLLALAGLSFLLEYHMERHVSQDAAIALAGVGFGGLLFGGAVWFSTRVQNEVLGRRDALLLVAMSWIGGAAFAALPFFVWAILLMDERPENPFLNYVNCYFESVSGLTTTGASILSNIEEVPRSLLLWRSSLQWLGGLGIVVLFVAVLPSLGVTGKKLYRVEAGTARQGLQPQIREAARSLWYIYLGLTVAMILLLCLFGMPLFESVCHTFSTLSTGGFSPRNESMAAYAGSVPLLVIVIVFMILGSLNFGLYNLILRRRFDLVWRDVELRFYLIMLAGCAVICAIAMVVAKQPIELVGSDTSVAPTAGNAALHASFSVVSVQSTSGFATADFNLWPFAAQASLVLCMFVGGCSGSTSGGIKVIRIWVVLRIILAEIERVFRPQVIRPVRIAGSVVEPELKLAALAYVLAGLFVIAAGSVLVMLCEQVGKSECSFGTAATASLASFCTIGPGLERVGPDSNFGWMTNGSKLILSLVMLLGRLELFGIIVLFSPRFWRKD